MYDNNYQPQPTPQPMPPQPMPPQSYGYGTPSNVKSATTAGLLGIFLGQVGAHNWYLGEKQKGLIHTIIFGVCVLAFIIFDFVIPGMSYRFAWWLLSGGFWLLPLIGVVWSANAIWGLVEGIIILSQGDAGLARKGYAVAAPVAPAPYPPQPYPAQPYPQQQPYPNQPYPNQPYPQQPYPSQPYPDQSFPGQPAPEQPAPEQPAPESHVDEQPRGDDPFHADEPRPDEQPHPDEESPREQ